MEQAKIRQRRPHSAQLKAEVLAACAEPGASVAAVALARGLNTNLVHKWRRQAARAASPASIPAEPLGAQPPQGAEFIALPLATSTVAAPSAPAGDIRIELRRGASVVSVHWPLAAAGECAAWLAAWLR